MQPKHSFPCLKRGLVLVAAGFIPALFGAETISLDFAQDRLPAGWSLSNPSWKAGQGRLEGTGDGDLDFAGPVTGDFTFRFTGWISGKGNLELKTLDRATGGDVYTFAFLGRYHRVLEGVKNCILREDTFVSVDPKQWIYPGRPFTCEIRVSQGRYQMFLDGEPGPDFNDPQPLRPPQGTKLRLLARFDRSEDRVRIENVQLILADRSKAEKPGEAAAATPSAAKRSRGIYLVKLEPGKAKVTGPATPLTTSEQDCAPAWSPDGQSIAFKRRAPATSDGRMLRFDLVVRDMNLGRERLYPSKIVDQGCWSGPLWFPDGRQMLAKSFVDGGQRNYALDLPSGRPTEVPLPPYKPALAVSRDGKKIYCAAPDDITESIELVAVDVASGAQTPIWKSPFKFHFVCVPLRLALSPDGRTLAVVLPDGDQTSHLIRVNTDGSGYRDLYSAKGKAAGGAALSRSGLAWTDQGDALLFLEGSSQGQRLMRLKATGGTPEFMGLTMGGGDVIFDVSPDGTRLVLGPGEPTLATAPQ